MRGFASGLALLGLGFTLGAGTFWLVQSLTAAPHPPAQHAHRTSVPHDLPASPVPSPVFEREPNFMTDRDALDALPGRIHEALAWTGRIRYLHFDTNHVAVVIAEIEGGGLDTVVFSFGQVVRTPVAMSVEEKANLEKELFPLHQRYLDAIPAAVEAVVQANPTETHVDSVVLLGIAGAPRMEITPVHTREVLERVVTPLVP